MPHLLLTPLLASRHVLVFILVTMILACWRLDSASKERLIRAVGLAFPVWSMRPGKRKE